MLFTQSLGFGGSGREILATTILPLVDVHRVGVVDDLDPRVERGVLGGVALDDVEHPVAPGADPSAAEAAGLQDVVGHILEERRAEALVAELGLHVEAQDLAQVVLLVGRDRGDCGHLAVDVAGNAGITRRRGEAHPAQEHEGDN